MDNRLKFLYYMQTELWGHRRIGKTGNGKTGPRAKESPAGKAAGWF